MDDSLLWPSKDRDELLLNADSAGVVYQANMSNWEVSTTGKTFAFLVCIECMGLVAVGVVVLTSAQDGDTDDIYMAILGIYSALSFFYFAIDSILLENIFQFWASILAHGLIALYTVWNSFVDPTSRYFKKWSLELSIGVGAFQLVYLVLAPFIQSAFGWRLYKYIGGSIKLQNYYKTASMFFTLLKLDVFLGVLLIMLASFFLKYFQTAVVINIVAIVVVLAFTVAGYRSVTQESLRAAHIFYALAIIEPVYIGYKLTQMHVEKDKYSEQSQVAFPRFFVTGGIACVVRVLLVLFGHWCTLNFGKGLKKEVFERAPASQANGQSPHLTDQLLEYAHPLGMCACCACCWSSPTSLNRALVSPSESPVSNYQSI